MDFGLEILGKSDLRLVGGWASVEIVDLENDYVPVDELAKAMVMYMKNKNGQVFYEHQNKPVGRVIYWDIRKHPTTGKNGIYIIACLDKGYEFDDMIWEKVKKGELRGFSISGLAKSEDQVIKSEDGKEKKVRVLKNIELMEISLVHRPANPYASVEEYNMFAKGIRTSDIPNLIKDIISVVGDKVDTETLQKIIDIVTSYDKINSNSKDVSGDIMRDEKLEVFDDEYEAPVSKTCISKAVRSTAELRRILVGILDEAKKIRGFVYNHTQSGAYKGMADDIVITIQALIDEIDNGIIVVKGDRHSMERKKSNGVDTVGGMITSETEGYVNPTFGRKKDNDDTTEKKAYVKHYVKLGEIYSKIERLCKKI